MAAAASARHGPGQQLALPFELRERCTFAQFLVGRNGELLDRLRGEEPGFACLWLYGAAGIGKTHLLHAVCQHQPLACYVPATAVAAELESLAGYLRFATVAVDDVERWLGSRRAEVALFDFYNRLRLAGARLIVTASRSPLDCRFALPDLRSRLCAAACYRVLALPEEDKPALLAAAARQRGLFLGDDVARYLLARVPRDQGELLTLIDQLDRSSLAAQRRLTIPFVKEALCL